MRVALAITMDISRAAVVLTEVAPVNAGSSDFLPVVDHGELPNAVAVTRSFAASTWIAAVALPPDARMVCTSRKPPMITALAGIHVWRMAHPLSAPMCRSAAQGMACIGLNSMRISALKAC